MNLKTKILVAVLIVISILAMNCITLINSVKAANLSQISQIDLHYGGMCEQLLKYKGVPVKTTYVEYYGDDGKIIQHIVWIKPYLGVTDELEYTVAVNGKVQDLGLWRTVINGYPYKSLEELGVADIDEAFTATKQAVYCYLFENTPEDYEAIGEAGERTLNALKKIVSDAQNSTETPSAPTVEIIPENEEWLEDETDSKYVSKSYYIKSSTSHVDYEITINDGMPEGGKLTKLDGTESTKFSNNEKFKIMLPKEELKKDGEFTLGIRTEVKTKPVLYGASPNVEWQNYALTAYMLEDAETTFNDTYTKIEEPEIPKEPEEPEKPSTPEPEKPTAEVKILPVTGM